MQNSARSHGKRQTRTERRAAERVAAKSRNRQRAASRSRISLPTLIGMLVTLTAVVGIFLYAVLRTNNSSGGGAALADAASLNPSPSLIAKGSMAPDFTLQNVAGTPYHLAAQRGHPVLLEFFAVWCPVCHHEAPVMARLTREYERKGVRVWAILANPYGPNYDLSGQTDLTPAKKADLAWYARTYNVHHPQLVDPSFQVVNEYGVGAYPGLYVIDAKGRVARASKGYMPYSTLAKMLNSILASGAH